MKCFVTRDLSNPEKFDIHALCPSPRLEGSSSWPFGVLSISGREKFMALFPNIHLEPGGGPIEVELTMALVKDAGSETLNISVLEIMVKKMGKIIQDDMEELQSRIEKLEGGRYEDLHLEISNLKTSRDILGRDLSKADETIVALGKELKNATS